MTVSTSCQVKCGKLIKCPKSLAVSLLRQEVNYQTHNKEGFSNDIGKKEFKISLRIGISRVWGGIIEKLCNHQNFHFFLLQK